LSTTASYGDTPSIAKSRNVACFSPIAKAAFVAGEFAHACALSKLSNCNTTTREAGGAAPFAELEKVDLNFAEVVLKDGRIEPLEESTVHTKDFGPVIGRTISEAGGKFSG
jgi:hypothetical protein